MKKWQILYQKKEKDPKKIIKILLANRKIKTKKEINDFFNPPNPLNFTPSGLEINQKEVIKAIKTIQEAIKQKESIVVYGDYDADGVCGTAILWEVLNKLGAKVMPYIPHRVEEGYGLSYKGIDFVEKNYQVKLIITVDHGIGSVEKVDYAKKKGIKTVIVDHHSLPQKLPEAEAIVHTTLLCGAGVAWMLAKELEKNLNFLDLVAIATIADMIPLVSFNRALVKYGLEVLNKTQRLGLEALIKEAGLKKGEIDVYEVSYILAPRLNAMGRIEHAIDSLRLLCTKNKERAVQLAKVLNQTNKERQKLLEETLVHAESVHIQDTAVSQLCSKLIFLSHESYNVGIIGLVAGKLVEKFYRPAIVISKGEEFSKASARSINGFNIIETIRKIQDLLVDAGGHPMAAGFTVETKKLELVKQKLLEIVDKELDEEKLTRVLKIDCELGFENLTFEFSQELEKFAPFGFGNPEPVFVSRQIVVKDAKIVGNDGQHLRLFLFDPLSKKNLSAVAFGMGDFFQKLSPEQQIDIAYTISVDEWNGQKRLELKLKDIKIPKV